MLLLLEMKEVSFMSSEVADLRCFDCFDMERREPVLPALRM